MNAEALFRPTNSCFLKGKKLWRVRYVFPPDPDTGKRREPLEAYGKREVDAVTNLKKKFEELNTRKTASSSMTVSEFIKDEFFPNVDAHVKNLDVRLSYNTAELRKSRLTRFVVEYEDGCLGTTRLKDLKPTGVYRHFEALQNNNACTGRVFNELRKDVIAVIRLILNRYSEDDTLDAVAFLKRVKTLKEKSKRKELYTADQILDAILDENKGLESRTWVAFIFFLCCRVEDVLALRWSDLDLKKGTVTFAYAVVRGEQGWHVKEGTKTGLYDGERLPLGTFLTDLLTCVYNARKRAGKAYPWVFCRADGQQLNLDSFYQDKGRYQPWRDIKADLGLPDGPSYYSLKTSANSYWLRHGVPLEVQLRKMRQSPKKLTLAQSAYREIAWDELVDAVTLRPRKKPPQEQTA